jgi:hypothetical protein
MLHSAFLDFLETIYSDLPFLYSPSYSAFFSEYFILRYYPFIFDLHFALFGGPRLEISAIQTPTSSLYPISTPANRFSVNSHSICSSNTHVLFLEHLRPIRAQNTQFLLFLYVQWLTQLSCGVKSSNYNEKQLGCKIY